MTYRFVLLEEPASLCPADHYGLCGHVGISDGTRHQHVDTVVKVRVQVVLRRERERRKGREGGRE